MGVAVTAGVTLTWHAQLRAKEMNLTVEDVALAVMDPEVDYPQTKGRYSNHRVAQRGNIGVPYKVEDDGKKVVLTVVWRTLEPWKR